MTLLGGPMAGGAWRGRVRRAAVAAALVALAACGTSEEATELAAEPTVTPTTTPDGAGGEESGDHADAGDGDDATAEPVADLPVAPDPCTLLTGQEVAAAVGEPVGDPDPFVFDAEGVTVRACSWVVAGSGTGQYTVAIVDDREWGDDRTASDFTEQQRADAGSITELEDLGDEAFADELGLWVRVGPLVVSVDAGHLAPAELLPLARAVLVTLGAA